MTGPTQQIACPACGRSNRVPVATGGTPRCASCHTDLPWLTEATAADFHHVDQAPDISAGLGVQGIPTMLLFHRGTELGRQVGALPIERIRAWVDATLDNASRA